MIKQEFGLVDVYLLHSRNVMKILAVMILCVPDELVVPEENEGRRTRP